MGSRERGERDGNFETECCLRSDSRLQLGKTALSCRHSSQRFAGRETGRSKEQLPHTDERVFSCNENGTSSTYPRTVAVDAQSYPEEEPPPHAERDEPTGSGSLSEHSELHPGGKPHACNECDGCPSNSDDFATRTRPYTKDNSCTRECYDKSSLSCNRTKRKQNHVVETFHACIACEKIFMESEILVHHKRALSGDEPLTCIECDETSIQFESRTKCQRGHLRETSHPCKESNRCSIKTGTLQTHQPSHACGKSSSCDESAKTFSLAHIPAKRTRSYTDEQASVWKKHDAYSIDSDGPASQRQTVSGETLSTCNRCDKTFIHPKNLSTHLRTGIAAKPCACDDINRGVSQHASLKTRKRMHSAEKPVTCDECDRRLFHPKGCLRHKRTHTTEKPNAHEDNDGSFVHVESLKIHNRAHHASEKPCLRGHCHGRCSQPSPRTSKRTSGGEPVRKRYPAVNATEVSTFFGASTSTNERTSVRDHSCAASAIDVSPSLGSSKRSSESSAVRKRCPAMSATNERISCNECE